MRLKLIIYSISLLVSLGCSTPEPLVERRYFWPPLPDEPRIEFVASYWSADDFPQTSGHRFLEATVGLKASRGFNKPWGIASDGEGKVYIVDTNLSEVVVFDLKNHSVDILGKGEHSGLFSTPIGIALDVDNNIYVSDPKKNRVFVFTKDEKPLRVIGSSATINWPVGMAIDNALKRLYVVNGRFHNIAVFNLDGGYLFSIGGRGGGDGEFNYPSDVDIDSKGNIIVADSMNARVQVLDHEGKFIRKFGQRGDKVEEFHVMKGIAVSRDDNIYVIDGAADKMLVFDMEGNPLTVIGGTGAVAETGRLTPGGFLMPRDVSIDKNNTIFVVDSMNKRFQIFQIIDEKWLKEHPIK